MGHIGKPAADPDQLVRRGADDREIGIDHLQRAGASKTAEREPIGRVSLEHVLVYRVKWMWHGQNVLLLVMGQQMTTPSFAVRPFFR